MSNWQEIIDQRALTRDEAIDYLCQSDRRFHKSAIEQHGITYPVFTHAPGTVIDMLRQNRAAHGDGLDDYLVYENERWSYDSFCHDVCVLAERLKSEFGMAQGDRVAVAMRNFPEMLLLLLAIPAAGGVVVLLNGWWTTSELEYALDDCGAKLAFADEERFDRLLPLKESRALSLVAVRFEQEGFSTYRPEGKTGPVVVHWPEDAPNPDDDFAIMYSSGTTGEPKGVVLTHRGAVAASYSWLMSAAIAPLMMDPQTRAQRVVRPQSLLIVTPLFHVTATHPMFLLSIPLGAKVTLMYKWDPLKAADLIENEQVTRFLGVPTQTEDLLQAIEGSDRNLDTLSFLSSGGAKRPAAQVKPLQDRFPQAAIASGWGMTETNGLGLGISGPTYLARPEAAGQPYPCLQEVKIVDEEGDTLPLGEVGELTVKSIANMRCYLNKPEATREVLQNGWLRTGDLAQMDDEGFVTIVDRKKNIIIRGGENIACLEVEGALHKHPDIIEAVVFSVPHARLGEAVGAAVQTGPDASLTEDAVGRFLSEHLAAFKIPAHYWFSSDPLARGATGKTDRKSIQAACLSGFETSAS